MYVTLDESILATERVILLVRLSSYYHRAMVYTFKLRNVDSKYSWHWPVIHSSHFGDVFSVVLNIVLLATIYSGPSYLVLARNHLST